ncbi:hypothetical protein TVAG_453160 [Trichomonas vaginalis G3]|uniref:receptor protein-tyrosine kinase n=1 Tax=Trichomonas vaginalis (strain ATCC PRA-98 / G3) TaxID=412133 RepID=A2ES62_TRIV3|nr:glycine-rich protein family [Trichomonas vaginalis G3]EAY04499.1 hypothetical protein TVAG_453160 [Trichomonas vaginalis G3]KAI5503276.1 glycine-rich protein family [Trichomonas vaginalis G3]|eukprot:XP_001316722.1 hypothetical protein [Trichomonas vaginalis G3]
MFGGTQTQGELRKGQKGIDSVNNQGGSGGCGSGYQGAYHIFNENMTGDGIFQSGGSGGSSYISGHPDCISPQYPSDTVANESTPFHESKFYFTNTNMKGGNEYMPDSFSNDKILGHVGHGACRITFLFNPICQTEMICNMHRFTISSIFLFVCLLS